MQVPASHLQPLWLCSTRATEQSSACTQPHPFAVCFVSLLTLHKAYQYQHPYVVMCFRQTMDLPPAADESQHLHNHRPPAQMSAPTTPLMAVMHGVTSGRGQPHSAGLHHHMTAAAACACRLTLQELGGVFARNTRDHQDLPHTLIRSTVPNTPR